jgi:hypothetical protein
MNAENKNISCIPEGAIFIYNKIYIPFSYNQNKIPNNSIIFNNKIYKIYIEFLIDNKLKNTIS